MTTDDQQLQLLLNEFQGEKSTEQVVNVKDSMDKMLGTVWVKGSDFLTLDIGQLVEHWNSLRRLANKSLSLGRFAHLLLLDPHRHNKDTDLHFEPSQNYSTAQLYLGIVFRRWKGKSSRFVFQGRQCTRKGFGGNLQPGYFSLKRNGFLSKPLRQQKIWMDFEQNSRRKSSSNS